MAVLRIDRQASMNRIAGSIGVHRATLYRHFPSRELLMERLTQQAISDGRAVIAAIPLEEPGIEEIRRLVAAIGEFGERYSFLIGSAPALDAGADPIGLTPLMERWQSASLIRDDLTPQWIATSFTALAIALQDSTNLQLSMGRSEVLFTTFVRGVAGDSQ